MDQRNEFLKGLAQLMREKNARLVEYANPLHGGTAQRFEVMGPEGKMLPIASSWLYQHLLILRLAGYDHAPSPA